MSDFKYSIDYLNEVMVLRKPQRKSLEILEDIFKEVDPLTNQDKKAALDKIHAKYPKCTDFERNFISLTFALATGVGKTRLMGAFIAYLYTNYGIKNFFIVAPTMTVYEKLKNDLSNWNSEKYVFKGLGCFSTAPQIIKDDDYKNQSIPLFNSEVRIFIYNIDKFNKEDANMKKVNEMIGDSFYNHLSKLHDLVLIMDESHHYRAERGAQVLNELNPILGLELTATPMVTKGKKSIPFKNVVYEYPLSAAISDGYTRTPYAVTRSNIDFHNFGDERLDKLMLKDGIICHENAKRKLVKYAFDNSTPDNQIQAVKPFMLVVCMNTAHANWVKDYVTSDDFCDGTYRNKTVIIHSKLNGTESEENTRLLLDVENPQNPIEIVIHVNVLKEGWDVNNLYTIVPLRMAESQILREQMVGRGLRLPYGVRTGDKEVDSVMLTAHDKFADILKDAQKGDSIFNSEHIIHVEEFGDEKAEITEVSVDAEDNAQIINEAYSRVNLPASEKNDALIKKVNEVIKKEVAHKISTDHKNIGTPTYMEQILHASALAVSVDPDFGEAFVENKGTLFDWMNILTEETCRTAQEKFIPIPQIKVTDVGEEKYFFEDFDLETSEFNHTPIDNNILRQNLISMGEKSYLKGGVIDFAEFDTRKAVLDELRKRPEIDYEKCSDLLNKLVSQAIGCYQEKYTDKDMLNIVMMYRRDISNKIYNQMMRHFVSDNTFLTEEISGSREFNLTQQYDYKERVNLFDAYTKNIKSVLFDGIKKGVFSTAKFDSDPEVKLAKILETDDDVVKWLRPAKKEFNITYNHGRTYEPDFVVETDNMVYLVEVKGENMLNAPDVIAKKECAERYCRIASQWSIANGYKEWRYLFIPSQRVMPNYTFKNLIYYGQG